MSQEAFDKIDFPWADHGDDKPAQGLAEIAERCEGVLPLGNTSLDKKVRIEQITRACQECCAEARKKPPRLRGRWHDPENN